MWNKEKIKEGFEKFFSEFGRYPTAEEIDRYQFLPLSRQIQRLFGGLVNLRRELGLAIHHYGSGKNRSEIAKLIGPRGSKGERNFEEILIQRFGEYFVHVEKPPYKFIVNPNDKDFKLRSDFLVYAKQYTFCVDVFYAKNYRKLTDIINIKQNKYSRLSISSYLINLNLNSDITDIKLVNYINNKRKILDPKIHIMNLDRFIEHMMTIEQVSLYNRTS